MCLKFKYICSKTTMKEEYMSDSFAKITFPKQYAKIEKARQSVMSNPLRMKDINSLMAIK